MAVSDLTAGRAVSAGDLSYTGTLTGSTGILNIGAGQLYKDASGRVGIATASPTASLSVGDDSTATSRQISLHGPASGANNGASINVRNGVDTVFALGNASNIVGGAYSSDAMLFWGNAALRFYGNGAERARIDNSGNLTANNGNFVVGTAGKGIDFSANGGDILTQYDEGTFTPTWSGGTVTVNQSNFTRIGRQVTWIFDLTFGASADPTQANISLPFNSSTWGVGSINFTDYGSTVAVNIDPNSDTLAFRGAMNAGNLASDVVATKRFIGAVTYFI